MYNIWKLNYWFNWRPETLPGYGLTLLVLLVALLVGIIFYLKKLKKQPQFGSYAKFFKIARNYCLYNAVIFAALAFFSWQLIPILAARVWLFLWIIIFILWTAWLIRRYLKLKRYLNSVDKSSFKNQKYLPKKK